MYNIIAFFVKQFCLIFLPLKKHDYLHYLNRHTCTLEKEIAFLQEEIGLIKITTVSSTCGEWIILMKLRCDSVLHSDNPRGFARIIDQ